MKCLKELSQFEADALANEGYCYWQMGTKTDKFVYKGVDGKIKLLEVPPEDVKFLEQIINLPPQTE